jgi:peptide chain release factor 1
MSQKHAEILSSLQGPSTTPKTSDLSALAPAASLYHEYEKLLSQLNDIQSLKAEAIETKDREMISECESEESEIYQNLMSLGISMTDAVIPKDPDDYNSDAIIEVRAGTGGDEACLFCSELLLAYQKTAVTKGWSFEILSESKTNLGGIKEAAFSITSRNMFQDLMTLGPYGFYRFESGVHRVQRVPINDVRIHTSAVSVAVLPSPNEDVQNLNELLPMSELKIETMR